MVLNSLRSHRKKFAGEYGELVICCDSREYWRKSLFEHYKSHRKKDRENSSIDWNEIFKCLNKVKGEINNFLPYPLVEVNGAEADDVIAVLCSYEDEKTLILSGDKDFMQLQSHPNVHQYSPMQKKFIIAEDPLRFKKEHIMRGDRGDGIPNFLSADDVFVTGGRQKPLSKKKVDHWLNLNPEVFCDYKMMRGYRRNELLVDLDKIPEDISENIKLEYIHTTENGNGRSKLLSYFMENKLKNLMENINDF
tara:strand:+ start:6142 stop:6891 length:750 start_codon:yes stop_codon:yes gene_type:complete